VNSFNAIEHTPSAYEYPLLIKQLLDSQRARPSSNEIVYRDQSRYGYPELARRIQRLANVLTNLGAKPGQTIAIMEWDSHRYLECYFAVPMLGCVMQTVNIRLSPEQILYTLNHAQADVIIVNAEFLPVLEALREKLETAKTFILIDEPSAQPKSTIPFSGEYESLLRQASADYAFADFDENTRMSTFYTSGTTGLPKGVYYSHRQMVLHTLSVLGTLGVAPVQGRVHSDDVYMPITPMFHVHAWGMPYVATLLGLKQVYAGRYSPELILKTIAEENVTYSHCVPTILHMLLSHPASRDVDLSRWKVLIGGSALPRGLARAALDRGIDVFTGYGMSETGPLQTINLLRTDQLSEDLDAQVTLRIRAGRPALMCNIGIMDSQGQVQPHGNGATGEIVFRSPWNTQGYFRNAETSEELWAGGWMHSGDIGSFTEDGVLQISDRVKDVIKTGGEWVSSLDLENLLSAHPAVSEVAVIGIKDNKWGERPKALIVLKPDQRGAVDAATLKAHMMQYADRGVISKYGVPESIQFVESLDKTSVGKLDKKALRSKYQDPA
jgi:fatty-acyl-CoA synthase